MEEHRDPKEELRPKEEPQEEPSEYLFMQETIKRDRRPTKIIVEILAEV